MLLYLLKQQQDITKLQNIQAAGYIGLRCVFCFVPFHTLALAANTIWASEPGAEETQLAHPECWLLHKPIRASVEQQW